MKPPSLRPVALPELPQEEAQRARGSIRKAKLRLIPLVVAMYVIAYVDRANIGFAALAMNADLGLSPEAFGFVAGVFYVGYVLFEIPSNLRLRRIGPRRMLAAMMVAWGIVSIGTAAARGVQSLSVLRFLLGVTEAGLAPGLIFYLTRWFPRRDLASVVSFYYLGIPLSVILSNPVSGLLLDHFGGVLGLRGWQWLFILEGLPALVCAAFVHRFLADSPKDAAWLDAGERRRYAALMDSQDEETRGRGHSRFWDALVDPRVWALGIAYSFTVIGITGLGFWMPQLLKEFAFGNTTIGLLSIVPYAIGTAAMFFWTRHSDATQERLWHFVIPSIVFSIGFAVNATASSPAGALAGMTLSVAGVLSAVPVFYTFPAAFLTDSASAGGLALINSLGNIGGFFGPYIIGILASRGGGVAHGLWTLAGLVLIAPALVIPVVALGRIAHAK